MGLLQFDVDALFEAVFQKRVFLGNDLISFPYTRNQIDEIRKEKRVALRSKKDVCTIDSDDELNV